MEKNKISRAICFLKDGQNVNEWIAIYQTFWGANTYLKSSIAFFSFSTSLTQ